MGRMYDDVIDPSPPVRLSISTTQNVAYGQKLTMSTAAAASY